MKNQNKKILLSFYILAALLWQTIPVSAQRTDAAINTTTILQEPNSQDRVNIFDSLLQQGRGTELKQLLKTIFGEDALAAGEVVEENPLELFKAVAGAATERSDEAQQEEIEKRKEKLNVKQKPKKLNIKPKNFSYNFQPKLNWRQFALGFKPLSFKPEVKITQTNSEIKAEGEDKKSFETDKATLKRTQKAESKFIKDGKTFGVEIKHTETIEGQSKTDGKAFRKETVMIWRAEVAACPDVTGITSGTGKGSVVSKTTITGTNAAATVEREVTAQTKTTGYVDDEAEMKHYDLEAEAVETIKGYDDAASRKLMTDVTFKDGSYRLRYEMSVNKIEINKTAEGGPRIPAKMGKIVVKMIPGSNVDDVKRTDKAAGALVAGIWNHTNDMYKAARSHWRNYGCVEIVSKATKVRLKKGEQISITSETVHKQDNSKVNARLEGGALDAEITPEIQQAAPQAKFNYRHGDKEKSDFTVESFSKRGIGIGGLEFITEQICNGGVSGKIEVTMKKSEGWTKVTKKGEHISDQYYTGTNDYKWNYDYNAVFNVSNSPADTYEDGTISATLKGSVNAKASRITDERDNWTTTTDCFPDPPRTAGQNSSSLIKEIGNLNGMIDDGMLQIEGTRFRLTFGVPEISATRTHRTIVKPFGWCMADANPPSDTNDESQMSFSNEAIEIEGTIDPKNPNMIEGSKTYTDELGNEVTISWSLQQCK